LTDSHPVEEGSPDNHILYLVRELWNKSLNNIAELFALRGYGGVGAACSVIEKQLKMDRGLRRWRF